MFGIVEEGDSDYEAVVRMRNWLVFSVFAFLFYGLWAFFPRLARNYINLPSVLFFEILGAMSVCALLLTWWRFQLQTKPFGILFGVMTAGAIAFGWLMFLFIKK